MTLARPAPTAGLDYSTKALNLAIVDGASLLDCWEDALGLDVANQIVTMTQTCRHLLEFDVETVYCEELWFGGGSKNGKAVSNVNTLSLHRTATRFETVATALGLKVHFVHVASWRKIVFGHGRPAEPKGASLGFVENTYGYKTTNHNMTDSICLAHYGAIAQRGGAYLLAR